MGIRLLASALATLVACNSQASTLPQLPPLKLADLTLPITAATNGILISASKPHRNADRQTVGSDYWDAEKQPLIQAQRWVF
ncbi:hypothetical protein [Pseudomonas rhizoryzae]|uniref:hypothetical protein n=1 Tax=Pseudomonas rhizoryzae TaxID=2571129 RepID=UPI0009C119B2|nr:hypothetical protein [Pseudomonas rhizoryzae]